METLWASFRGKHVENISHKILQKHTYQSLVGGGALDAARDPICRMHRGLDEQDASVDGIGWSVEADMDSTRTLQQPLVEVF